MDPSVLLSIPVGVLRWIGVKLGVTSAPNIVLRDWRTVQIVNDRRAAWYYWVHVRCVNEQRKGLSGWLTTETAIGCHARVELRRSGEGEQVVWSDFSPFTAGGLQLTETVDLIVDDERFFLPLFLDLPSQIPDPRGQGTIGPGLFPTGNQFFCGITYGCPTGSYEVTVSIHQGGRILVQRKYPQPVVVPVKSVGQVGPDHQELVGDTPNSPLTIVSAKYVSKDRPAFSGNVKKSIRAYVSNSQLNIPVENRMFTTDIPPDGDPDPGHAKKLIVDYRVGDGPLCNIAIDEHENLRLPLGTEQSKT
jgi:hypothetical protein